MSTDPFLPANMPPVAYEPWTDLRLRDDIAALHPKFPYGPLPRNYSRKIRQSYYAATSYMDHLVGKLLTGLKKFGFAENTIVIFFGDHGIVVVVFIDNIIVIIKILLVISKVLLGDHRTPSP